MKRTWITLLLGLALVGAGATSAAAQTFGPFCFDVSSPFGGTVQLFLTTVSNQHFSAVGNIVSNGRPVQGTIFINSATNARLFFIESLQGTSPSLAVGADLSLSTGSGSGRCERLAGDAATGCTQNGSDVTVTFVPCP